MTIGTAGQSKNLLSEFVRYRIYSFATVVFACITNRGGAASTWLAYRSVICLLRYMGGLCIF